MPIKKNMPLDKSRRKFEATFTTKLEKWLKHNACNIIKTSRYINIGPIEVKVSYEKRFNIKTNIKTHQLRNLMAIRDKKTVVYKISDIDMLTRKPWDLDLYTNSFPLFALMWYRGGNKTFFLIDPATFYDAIKRGRKSFTELEIEKECVCVGHLIN